MYFQVDSSERLHRSQLHLELPSKTLLQPELHPPPLPRPLPLPTTPLLPIPPLRTLPRPLLRPLPPPPDCVC